METPVPIPGFAGAPGARPGDEAALAAFLRANHGRLVRLELDMPAARVAADAADPRVRRLQLQEASGLEEIVLVDAATPPAVFAAGGSVLARGHFRVAADAAAPRATLVAVPENAVLSDPGLDYRWRPL